MNTPHTPPRFVLCAEDGRMVTYDTRTGPALTANRELSYVWTSDREAETQRRGYESALGVSLAVKPQPPRKPVKPFVSIDARWWSLGVVDAFQQRAQRPGVVDGFSYSSGRVEGEAARLQGVPVDTVLAKYKVPYREADFRPLPPLVAPPKDSP